MDLTPEKIRARFHELTAKREKTDEELDPLRAELNDLVAGDTELSVKAAKERETVIRKRIVELQNELHPVEMERALCARALNGKTGVPA